MLSARKLPRQWKPIRITSELQCSHVVQVRCLGQILLVSLICMGAMWVGKDTDLWQSAGAALPFVARLARIGRN